MKLERLLGLQTPPPRHMTAAAVNDKLIKPGSRPRINKAISCDLSTKTKEKCWAVPCLSVTVVYHGFFLCAIPLIQFFGFCSLEDWHTK